MPSITIHGPTTATVAVGAHRILLGTADAPAGDPVLIILNRTCVEDAARLPSILRHHNAAAGKTTVVTGNPRRLSELVKTDEICETLVHGKPLAVSMESYAAVIDVPKRGDDAQPSLVVYRSKGCAIFVERCGWMREDDALRTWVFTWDHQSPHSEQIDKALFEGDQAARDAINASEQEITKQLDDIGQRIRAGEHADPKDAPRPIVTRLLWAPYQRYADDVFAHIVFTLRRPPYDAGGAQGRQGMLRAKYTEDIIGKELHL